MIKGRDLEDRMGGQDEPGSERPAPAESRPRGASAPKSNDSTAEQALMDRILAKVKALKPGADRHCEDCWTRGRDAVVRMLEEGPA